MKNCAKCTKKFKKNEGRNYQKFIKDLKRKFKDRKKLWSTQRKSTENNNNALGFFSLVSKTAIA